MIAAQSLVTFWALGSVSSSESNLLAMKVISSAAWMSGLAAELTKWIVSRKRDTCCWMLILKFHEVVAELAAECMFVSDDE